MDEDNKITILNMTEKTRTAVSELMKKENSPFNSVEECVAHLISFTMQLKALGRNDEAETIENAYHLKGIQVFYSQPKDNEDEKKEK